MVKIALIAIVINNDKNNKFSQFFIMHLEDKLFNNLLVLLFGEIMLSEGLKAA